MRLRKGVLLTRTDEGTFLLDTRGGRYWHLNPNGFDVLESLLNGESFDAVVDELASAERIDREIVADDCEALVRDLRAARLLKGSR
ncbi:lasso peptide biosynthesis PqqD family chaperone [Cellulomonas sp. Y8]|uniref:lasso peptide biosynthesis PqqD family chaperone n=1 Tax=Cellulomonas sp. Y8 TaxID=2591145 RepID=UPI003D73FDB8